MYGFLYSKPSPVGEGGIRAFASMTDEVFAFSSSIFPSGIPCPDTSSTASGPPFISMRKHCISSATCCGISSTRSVVYHHGSAVHIINVQALYFIHFRKVLLYKKSRQNCLLFIILSIRRAYRHPYRCRGYPGRYLWGTLQLRLLPERP